MDRRINPKKNKHEKKTTREKTNNKQRKVKEMSKNLMSQSVLLTQLVRRLFLTSFEEAFDVGLCPGISQAIIIARIKTISAFCFDG